MRTSIVPVGKRKSARRERERERENGKCDRATHVPIPPPVDGTLRTISPEDYYELFWVKKGRRGRKRARLKLEIGKMEKMERASMTGGRRRETKAKARERERYHRPTK